MSEEYTEDNGWDEYKKLVLSEIRRIADYTEGSNKTSNDNYKELLVLIDKNYKETISVRINVLQMIGKLREDIGALKVKAGIWGSAAAIGTVLVALGIFVVQQALAAPH